ncbi:serine threonine- kinase [Chlorella sorokiniana]|uniref:Serine threonine-kinase n=1 Tax=Chlorella sorokiniana TaxID=3076 RepID=A0A2P6TEM4_CHLSO|nr:serine threonine- kinase [Chlorella sorokiniana]|eukprot:PRW21099.1 serine threonine- kinase [Chlorella sorokiniana]
MELEECLSEAEDWVFNTACEGAACWQPNGMESVPATIGARVELPPALANGNGGGTMAHSNGNGKLASSTNGNGTVHMHQDEGPMDQDALDAWRATMDIAQGDGGAGLPEEEQLRSRESLLLSVDGMVGNWELYSTGISTASGSFSEEEEWAALAPAAALPADPAASGEYAALLAELQQLADSAGLTSRLTQSTEINGSAATAAGGALVGEGASVTDIEPVKAPVAEGCSQRGPAAMLRLLVVLLSIVAAAGQAEQPAQAAAATATERDILLGFKARIENFAEVQVAWRLRGWSQCPAPDCLLPCSWGGVLCDSNNRVAQLQLSCPESGCPGGVAMRGTLGPGIEQLQYLQILDLGGNALNGTLPVLWGLAGAFPALQILTLERNQLSGPIPEEWARSGGFQELVEFDLAYNQLTGPFPAVAYTNTSFFLMQSFDISFNRFSGPLPDFWNGLIILVVVNIEGNQFTGTIPEDWGGAGYYFNNTYNDTQAIEYLRLGYNQLTGGLPPGFAANGSFTKLRVLSFAGNTGLGGTLPPEFGDAATALPSLQTLDVSSCGLTGALPAQWGPGLQSLQSIDLSNNSLQGSIPATWADMPSLRRIDLQPGNPAACPQAPAGSSFKVCSEGDVLCVSQLPYNDSLCQGSPYPPDDGGGSSFPVAAVAVPVAVVGAAVVATWAYWLWRRRRRAAARQAAAGAQQQQSVPKEWVGHEWGLAGGAYASPFGAASFGPPAEAFAVGVQQPSSGGASHNSAKLQKQGSDSSCLPCLRSTQSVQTLPVMQSAQSLPHVPNSAPLWLPHPPSGGAMPTQPSTASGGSGASAAAGLAHGWGPLPAHPPGVSSGGSSGEHGGHAARDRMRLEQLVEADWRIPPEAIEILKRPDGSPWQLGSGGFGTVFKALRNGVTPVAVKVLGASVESARKMMDDEDFYREIMILRACRDTNILQFQGACFKDDRTLLVTEYMEGGNLTANLKAHTVTWFKRGKKIALDVARALVYLHSRRIVHLDIKSANVLLTRDGTAKVGDVGMAKIMAEDYVSGGQGAFGTLAWSAPELLLGRRCDGKADIYSFGVVLWELCTGLLPVRGQLREPAVPDDCPEEVLDIIRRCLDPDPSVRPTAAELVQLLTLAPAPPPPAGSEPPSAPAVADKAAGGEAAGSGPSGS